MAKIGEVFDDIAEAVAEAHRRVSEKFVDELKYKVSVPVQYVTGPKGGIRVIRSKKGQPPRLETGELQESIKAETIHVGEQISTGVTVSAEYAGELQEHLLRPITEDEDYRLEVLLLRAVDDAVTGR